MKRCNALGLAVFAVMMACALLAAQTAADFAASGSKKHGKRDFDGAIADYTKAIELKPNDANAYNNRGTAYLDNKQPREALADFNQAIALDIAFVSAYYNRATARRALNDSAGAAQDSLLAMRMQQAPPTASAATTGVTITTTPSGQDRPNNIIQDSPGQTPSPADAVKLAAAYRLSAMARRQERNFPAALAAINRAIELDPNSAESLVLRATIARPAGQPGDALADLTRALELKPPNSSDVYILRAELRQSQGDTAGAIADSTAAVTAAPNAIAAWMARGASYLAARQPTPAVQDYSKAVELAHAAVEARRPEGTQLEIDAYRARAKAREAMADAEGARADAKKADELAAAAANKMQQAFAASQFMTQATQKRIDGDFAGAAADYTEMLRQDPSQTLNYVVRAQLYLLLDRPDDAIADTERLLAPRPNPLAFLVRACARQLKGDHQAALSDYDQAIATRSELTGEAYFFRRTLLRRLGRSDSSGPLAAVKVRIDQAWAGLLGGYLDGTVTEAELLANAGAIDPNGILHRQCLAFYHLGMTALARGDTARARDFFQRGAILRGAAINNGPAHVISAYVLARAELAKLGAR